MSIEPKAQSANRLILTDSERASNAWQALYEFMENKVKLLDATNRGSLNEMDTARVRGQIAILTEIMSANNKEHIIETSNL